MQLEEISVLVSIGLGGEQPVRPRPELQAAVRHRRVVEREPPYRGVPVERVIENVHFTAFAYQFGLFNDPF